MLAALEADLLTAGFIWDEIPQRVSWRAAVAMFVHARRDSAVFQQHRRENLGDYAFYTQDTHLLTLLLDEQRTANYYYASAHGAKGLKPPKPGPRPGVEDARPKEIERAGGVITGNHVGSAPIPMRDFERFWADPQGYMAEVSKD